MTEYTEPYSDSYWMEKALDLAGRAKNQDEVPVGAIVVRDREIVGEGWNNPISACDPTAHAEIQALRAAAQSIGNYRLVDCVLYVTLEPCIMCAGAIIHARLAGLVYGATEPKAGAVVSRLNLLNLEFTNHNLEVKGGVLESQCSRLISDFFAAKRMKK